MNTHLTEINKFNLKKTAIKLILFFSFLLLGISWLSFDHVAPWTTYLGEVCGFVSAITLGLLLWVYKPKIPLILLPIVIIACIPIVQYITGIIYFKGLAVLVTSYIFMLFVVAVSVYNYCINHNSAEKILLHYSVALIIVGVVSSCIAILQWLNLEGNIPFIVHLKGNRPYGNFAQPNHLALLLLLAVVAIQYLNIKSFINKYLMLILSFFFIFAIALTQSRAALIIMLALCLFSFYYEFFGKIKTNYFIFIFYFILLLLLMLNLHNFDNYLTQIMPVSVAEVESFSDRNRNGLYRLVIWKEMLLAIQQQPWIGYGWGQVTSAQAEIFELLPHFEWINSSHNIVFDILVENGVVLGGAIIFYAFYLFIKIVKHIANIETLFAFLFVVPIVVSAFLEFPHKYSYFLMPFAICLGILVSSIENQKRLNVYRIVFIFVTVISVLLLNTIWNDYINSLKETRKSAIFESYRITDVKPKFDEITQYELSCDIIVLDQFCLMSEWNVFNPFVKTDISKINDFKHLVDLYPSSYYLLKMAQLLAYNGYLKESNNYLFKLKVLYNIEVTQTELLTKNIFEK